MFQPIRSFDNKKMIVFPVNEGRENFYLHTESGVQELPKSRLEIARCPRSDGKYYVFLLREELNLPPAQASAYSAVKAFIFVVDDSDPYLNEIANTLAKIGVELFGLL